ncbi:MAG TPA: HNH endonuclease signature motif containing protein [Rhizomicrobium sp.]|jgi:hypothetical protein|nr:HNH endonuclease signature motif containing protein [Rhizomicrobium sp.]
MVVIFDNRERAYKGWLGTYQKGFVLNVLRSRNPTFVGLHRASCLHIAEHNGPAPFTGQNYIKICHDAANALTTWAENYVGPVTRYCEDCNPPRVGHDLSFINIDPDRSDFFRPRRYRSTPLKQRKRAKTKRQFAFETLLKRIAAARKSRYIPTSFRTLDGECHLDFGALGHAVENGVVAAFDSNVIPNFVRLLKDFADDARAEVKRNERKGMISTRPGQTAFSEAIRQNYEGRCAITGCEVEQALEAAHIRVQKGVDINEPGNGILLRADIHALFDAHLFTFSPDGRHVQICRSLAGGTYDDLKNANIRRPICDPPSMENRTQHRKHFKLRMVCRR